MDRMRSQRALEAELLPRPDVLLLRMRRAFVPRQRLPAAAALRTEDAVVVPTVAVQRSQNGNFVFVVKDGAAKVTPVKVDRTSQGFSVISEGLSGDENVVVIDEPGTRLGLPEVMLGIVPGWGGIKRLPRLIGAPAALDLLLTGKTIDARKARRLGLADECVPARIMDNTARGVLLARPAPRVLRFSK